MLEASEEKAGERVMARKRGKLTKILSARRVSVEEAVEHPVEIGETDTRAV
jgi:hypothetical protein